MSTEDTPFIPTPPPAPGDGLDVANFTDQDLDDAIDTIRRRQTAKSTMRERIATTIGRSIVDVGNHPLSRFLDHEVHDTLPGRLGLEGAETLLDRFMLVVVLATGGVLQHYVALYASVQDDPHFTVGVALAVGFTLILMFGIIEMLFKHHVHSRIGEGASSFLVPQKDDILYQKLMRKSAQRRSSHHDE